MRSYYDKDVDVLMVRLSDNKPEYGEDIGRGIIVHFDKNRNPVEIEILSAKKYLMDWLGQALEVKTRPMAAV